MGKIVAAVLAILLGGFGAHKFYQGNMKLGVVYLVLFWTIIPFFVGLVEGVLMLLSDDDKYQRKYADGSFMGR